MQLKTDAMRSVRAISPVCLSSWNRHQNQFPYSNETTGLEKRKHNKQEYRHYSTPELTVQICF